MLAIKQAIMVTYHKVQHCGQYLERVLGALQVSHDYLVPQYYRQVAGFNLTSGSEQRHVCIQDIQDHLIWESLKITNTFGLTYDHPLINRRASEVVGEKRPCKTHAMVPCRAAIPVSRLALPNLNRALVSNFHEGGRVRRDTQTA